MLAVCREKKTAEEFRSRDPGIWIPVIAPAGLPPPVAGTSPIWRQGLEPICKASVALTRSRVPIAPVRRLLVRLMGRGQAKAQVEVAPEPAPSRQMAAPHPQRGWQRLAAALRFGSPALVE